MIFDDCGLTILWFIWVVLNLHVHTTMFDFVGRVSILSFLVAVCLLHWYSFMNKICCSFFIIWSPSSSLCLYLFWCWLVTIFCDVKFILICKGMMEAKLNIVSELWRNDENPYTLNFSFSFLHFLFSSCSLPNFISDLIIYRFVPLWQVTN